MKRKVDTGIKLFGIFGFPVAHSFSPAMHQAAFRAVGLNGFYVPFLVSPVNLKNAVRALPAFSIDGINVTVPHKKAIVPFLDELKGDAKWMGAVNTVVVRQGKLTGYNTDGLGFLTSLRKDAQVDPKGKRAVLLGAGGAAEAVAYNLVKAEVKELTLVNRTLSKVLILKRKLQELRTPVKLRVASFQALNLLSPLKNGDLIINATSVGLEKKESLLIQPEVFSSKVVAVDLVYGHETLFMRIARQKGARVIGGLGMLLYQGALAFELWTGRKPPLEVMRKTLLKQLAQTK